MCLLFVLPVCVCVCEWVLRLLLFFNICLGTPARTDTQIHAERGTQYTLHNADIKIKDMIFNNLPCCVKVFLVCAFSWMHGWMKTALLTNCFSLWLILACNLSGSHHNSRAVNKKLGLCSPIWILFSPLSQQQISHARLLNLSTQLSRDSITT